MVLRKGYVVGRVSLLLSTFFLSISCFCIYTLVSYTWVWRPFPLRWGRAGLSLMHALFLFCVSLCGATDGYSWADKRPGWSWDPFPRLPNLHHEGAFPWHWRSPSPERPGGMKSTSPAASSSHALNAKDVPVVGTWWLSVLCLPRDKIPPH